jgi:hypothetical protein
MRTPPHTRFEGDRRDAVRGITYTGFGMLQSNDENDSMHADTDIKSCASDVSIRTTTDRPGFGADVSETLNTPTLVLRTVRGQGEMLMS